MTHRAPTTVAVAGAAGRMGQMTVAAIKSAGDLSLVAAIGRSDDLRSRLEEVRPDVLIDFTTPDVGADHLDWAIELGISPVVGTTGLPPQRLAASVARAREARLGGVIAPNFAVGAVLMMELAKRAAPHLDAIEIIEAHHPAKKDAPSGTAARTRAGLAMVLGRDADSIPIHSVRLPGFIASQEVILGGHGERLSIRHDTLDRTCFAPGILLAVRRARSLDHLVLDLAELLFEEEDRCAPLS